MQCTDLFPGDHHYGEIVVDGGVGGHVIDNVHCNVSLVLVG